MDRWRRAALLVAMNFAAIHLVLWSPLALAMLYDTVRRGDVGDWGAPAALVLVLGVLGAVGVALPLRALWRGGRWIGLALILAGLLYAYVAALGLLLAWHRLPLSSAAFGGLEAWVIVVLLITNVVTGEDAVLPTLLAATYTAALVLGGALTLRSDPPTRPRRAAAVDGGDGRR